MNLRAFVSWIAIAAVVTAPFTAARPSVAAGSPPMFGVVGCPLLGTRTLAGTIFGSYEYSAGGERDFTPGAAMLQLLPAGGSVVECVFVRRWDAKKAAATPDSDILISGYGLFSNSSARSHSWNALIAKLGLTTTSSKKLHYAERQGFSAGYRDGLNTIAFAFWMSDPKWDYENVAPTTLRPFVTTVVCAGYTC